MSTKIVVGAYYSMAPFVIDAASKELEAGWPVMGLKVTSCRPSPDGSRLAITHGDHEDSAGARLSVVDTATKQVEPGWDTLSDATQAGRPAWSPDGTLLAVPTTQGLRVLSAETGQVAWTFGSTLLIQSVSWSADSQLLIYSYTVSPRFGVLNREGVAQSGWGPASYANTPRWNWSPTGEYISGNFANWPPQHVMIDVATKQDMAGLAKPTSIGGTAWSPDGQYLALSRTSSIEVFDMGDGGALDTSAWAGPHGSGHLAYSQDGTRLYMAEWQGPFRVWDTATRAAQTGWPAEGSPMVDPDEGFNWQPVSIDEFTIPPPEVRRAVSSEDVPAWDEAPVGSRLTLAGGSPQWVVPPVD